MRPLIEGYASGKETLSQILSDNFGRNPEDYISFDYDIIREEGQTVDILIENGLVWPKTAAIEGTMLEYMKDLTAFLDALAPVIQILTNPDLLRIALTAGESADSFLNLRAFYCDLERMDPDEVMVILRGANVATDEADSFYDVLNSLSSAKGGPWLEGKKNRNSILMTLASFQFETLGKSILPIKDRGKLGDLTLPGVKARIRPPLYSNLASQNSNTMSMAASRPSTRNPAHPNAPPSYSKNGTPSSTRSLFSPKQASEADLKSLRRSVTQSPTHGLSSWKETEDGALRRSAGYHRTKSGKTEKVFHNHAGFSSWSSEP